MKNKCSKTDVATPHSQKQMYQFNPLTPRAISERLGMIGNSTYILTCSIATAPDSDINQTAGSGGQLSKWKNRCMSAVSGQPKRACDAAKSGEFLGVM